MKKTCDTCQRLNAKTRKCRAMSELIKENCWAWTDDPDWREKVEKDIEAYRKMMQ